MVKHLTLLFMLLSFSLFSGEFMANVSRNQVNLGGSVTLNLTLKGTSAKEAPSIEALKKTFTINSQQQSFSTVVINGRVTTNTIWTYVLIPQAEGDVTIPTITITTSDGLLATAPITIKVDKRPAAIDSKADETPDIVVNAFVSNQKPYKNEPLFYTVRLTSKRDLMNVMMQKIAMEDAVIESHGEPKVYEKVVDGIKNVVVEFQYLVTPLKAGTLKIPSAIAQGSIPTKRKSHLSSPFDDDYDPFSIMQGFHQMKPFALGSEETLLDVQAPIADVNPWLPAKALKIEELWSEASSLQVGDPLTRGFKIIAEGISSNQLPSLSDQQISSPSIKIYADKPELGDGVNAGIITSYRQEQYTLIPQQAGTVTLPEISVTWWDVTKKEKVVAHIPSRTLHVMPAPDSAPKNNVSLPNEVIQTETESPADHFMIYAVMAGLLLFLVAAICWGVSLQRKITRMSDRPNQKPPEQKPAQQKPPKKSKSEKLPDLNPT